MIKFPSAFFSGALLKNGRKIKIRKLSKNGKDKFTRRAILHQRLSYAYYECLVTVGLGPIRHFEYAQPKYKIPRLQTKFTELSSPPPLSRKKNDPKIFFWKIAVEKTKKEKCEWRRWQLVVGILRKGGLYTVHIPHSQQRRKSWKTKLQQYPINNNHNYSLYYNL